MSRPTITNQRLRCPALNEEESAPVGLSVTFRHAAEAGTIFIFGFCYLPWTIAMDAETAERQFETPFPGEPNLRFNKLQDAAASLYQFCTQTSMPDGRSR